MFKIIADSCCDVPPSYKNSNRVTLIPLKISVGGKDFTDNGSIDQKELLEYMKKSANAPMTTCPTPMDYAEAMKGEEDVFCVTLSTHLSGSFQSAVIGAGIKSGGGRVYVFDSQSASAGEALIVHKLMEFIEQGLSYDEIIKNTEAFIKGMETIFVLQSLDNLIKNGRMGRIVGQMAAMLKMCPVMGAHEGRIKLIEKCRGSKNAFKRLVEIIDEKAKDDATVFIANCNCPEIAMGIEENLCKGNDRNVIITSTGGLSTTYANDGGIVIAF